MENARVKNISMWYCSEGHGIEMTISKYHESQIMHKNYEKPRKLNKTFTYLYQTL